MISRLGIKALGGTEINGISNPGAFEIDRFRHTPPCLVSRRPVYTGDRVPRWPAHVLTCPGQRIPLVLRLYARTGGRAVRRS